MLALNESTSDLLTDKSPSRQWSKWSCDLCTFLNHNKSLKCIQCLTPRNHLNSTYKTELESELIASNEVLKNRSSPESQGMGSDSNTTHRDSYHNDKNRYESIGVEAGFKWSCSACTYDNWNAAKKCVLCATPRKNTSSSERQETSNDATVETYDRKESTSPLIPTIAAKGSERSANISDSHYNNIKNKINENLSEVKPTSRQDIDYIDDRSVQPFYDLDLLIGQSSRPVRAKRVPSDVNPYLGDEIRRLFSNALKQRKGEFGCYFVTELITFALPPEIEDLSPDIQQRLFDEYLDRDVQKGLLFYCNSLLIELFSLRTGRRVINNQLEFRIDRTIGFPSLRALESFDR